MTAPPLRWAVDSDALQMARLLTRLGHSTDRYRIENMWAQWTLSGNKALVYPDNDASLVGIATLHQMSVLHRPKPVGRITALFVEEDHRGRGIGKALVEAAEEHFAAAGCGLVEVTSNLRLTDAHRFYERMGYGKTSVRLAKQFAEC